MSETVFGEDCFSKSSQDIYLQVVSENKVKQQMAVIDDHNIPTGIHSRGVAQMVSEYIEEGIVDLDPSHSEAIIRSTLLHDIGKLSISNSILDKPGSLNRHEWLEIQTHPVDGFHRYAIDFNAYEALPVLMHHIFQGKNYPTSKEQKQAISIHGLEQSVLDEEEVLIHALMVAVADHFEARYPIADPKSPLSGIRSYTNRNYSVNALSLLVEASFVEAGKVDQLDLNSVLDKLIECSQEVLLKK